MDGLTTSELAKRSQVNVESIRFYERQGLLPAPARTPGGYRMFTDDHVRRVRFIKRAQELGFSLREIRDLLALRLEPGTSCADVRERAEAKLADIGNKIRDLQRMRRALAHLTTACPGRGATSECPILESLDSTNPVPPYGP